jgi:ferredoxin
MLVPSQEWRQRMAYVIAEPCFGVKDTACVDACPVDCIHPKKETVYEDGRPAVGRS